MIRVADYIADFIYNQGVEHVFMLSGGGSIYLDDGIACHKKLKHVCARNEAAAPMMAEAYARLTGNLGVVYVTTGPGGTNAVGGLSEAWVDSAPILIISGQVQREHTSYNAKIKKLRSFGVQELNIIDVVKPITKYACLVNQPESIRYHLEKAIHLAKSGRPGPVWLDIPLDVQSARIDSRKLKGYKPVKVKKSSLTKPIKKIIQLIKKAKQPLIIVGQGVRIAGVIKEFKQLVAQLNVAVVSSRLGQDILAFSHPNNFGHGGIKGQKYTDLIMKESDLIISIGSRLSVPFVGLSADFFSKKAKVVMVDIDSAELKKPFTKIHLGIKADAKDFIRCLSTAIKQEEIPSFKQWLNKCKQYKEQYPLITKELIRNPINLYYFISRLDALADKQHVFVSDAGSSYYVAGQALRFEAGQREITSGAFASMGLAIPLAIGCSYAAPDKQILAITGDGSLELNIQELKTMSFYRRNIKLFVINNGGYVSIRNTQDNVCAGRYIGSETAVAGLDMQKIAQAFDLEYMNIQDANEIDQKIKQALQSDKPVFVEVVCDSKQKIIEPLKIK